MIAVWLRAGLGAVTFLTILPAGRWAAGARDMRHVAAWFPAVGLALGGVIAGAAWLVAEALPPMIGGVLLTALAAALTGGLHLDGVADLFDGLGHSGRPGRRALAIMRDSRIGSHGAVALVLLLAAKALSFGVLLEGGQFSTIALCSLVARGLVVPFVALLRPARREGLGWALHRASSGGDVVVACVGVAVAMAWGGVGVLPSMTVALAAMTACAVWARVRLGGLTGDVYGAMIELAEAAFLIAAARL